MSKIFVSKIYVSRIFSGILGAVAVSLTLGAVQFASGSDLISTMRDVSTRRDLGQTGDENYVNRAAKSDRAAVAGTLAGQSQIISVRLDGLSATSIVIRLPAQLREEARNRLPVPGLTKEPAYARKSTVACDPVVSVLTEVAKQLQPGRCVT
jgi:hypothetical protein